MFCRHAVANAIVEMSSYTVSEKRVGWLEVIPLVNFLREGNLKRPSLFEEDPKRIHWSTIMNLYGARLDVLRTKTRPVYVVCVNLSDYFCYLLLIYIGFFGSIMQNY